MAIPPSNLAPEPAAPSPPKDMWTWLTNFRPMGTLIDIGANDGSFGEFLSTFLQVRRCYSFEPQKYLCTEVATRLKHVPFSRVFPVALADQSGRTEFFINSNHPSSSLLHVSDHSKREFPQTGGEQAVQIELARLDDLLTDEDMEGEVFLKIDVQGAEDKVIRGGRRVFSRARFVLIEMSFVPFYEGQPLFEEVHQQLVELGFRFVGMKNQVDSTQTGQPLFAHCLYHRP